MSIVLSNLALSPASSSIVVANDRKFIHNSAKKIISFGSVQCYFPFNFEDAIIVFTDYI